MVSASKGVRGKQRTRLKSQTSRDLKKRRPWMILATGDEGTGKTHFSLTYLLYAYYEVGLDIDDIRMIMIDPDDGVARLLDVNVIPEILQERITFFYTKNWKDLISATDDAYEELAKHVEKRGLRGWRGSIIVVENMGMMWDWAQDDYVQDVYHKTLGEKALEASKIAKEEEKKMHPTLSPIRDYGVINKKHDAWSDGMRNSGFNFIWTAHYKVITVSKGDGKEEVVREKIEGKRNIGGKIDVVIKFHQDGGKYLADIIKGRGLSKRVENREMDFTEFVRLFDFLQKNGKKWRNELFVKLEKRRQQVLRDREKAKREKEEKTTVQKTKTEDSPQISQPSEKDTTENKLEDPSEDVSDDDDLDGLMI